MYYRMYVRDLEGAVDHPNKENKPIKSHEIKKKKKELTGTAVDHPNNEI